MKKSVSEIDCAGILSIIINNKFFDQALGGGGTAGSNDDFKKARDARNEILHEPNLKLLSGKLHYYICLFIKILTGSAINQTPAVQTALEKLTQIQNGQYMLSKAEEVAILKLKEKAAAEIETTTSFALIKIGDSGKECIKQTEKKIDTKTEQAIAAVQQMSQTSSQKIDTKTEQAVATVEQTSQTSSQRIDTKTKEAVAVVERTSKTSSQRLDTKTEQAVAAIQQASQRSSRDIERHKSKSEGFLSTLWQKKYLKRDLIAYYRREFSTLSISPLFQKNEAPLLQFYRTPSLYQIQETSPEQRGTSALKNHLHRDQVGKWRTEINSLENIFLYGKKLNHCIYVTADTGYGKTSFSKKLLIDWCQAQNCIKSDVHFYKDSDVAIMKHFDYVFFVPLRNFREVGYLDDMIQRQMVEFVHHRYTKAFLQNILETKHCLIILDGLDEWIPSESKYESEIPVWKFRKYCTVLITTRMWKFSTLCLQPKDVHIEMAGLKDTDSNWLACKAVAFLNQKYRTDKSSELFCSQLVEHNLHDIMQVPLLLMQCLCLWYDGRSVGKSQVQIYFNLIELLAIKNEFRLKTVVGESVGSVNTKYYLPAWFRENTHCCILLKYLFALGKLSFFTLFGKDQTSSLVFSESVAHMYITTAELEFGVNIGLLTMEKPYGKHSSRLCIISFIHKTYQEILASLYIVSQFPTPDQMYNIIDEFCCSVENVISMSNVFQFLCRLRGEMFEEIFKRFRHCVEGYNRNIYSIEVDNVLFSYQKMILECLEEATASDKRITHDIQLFDIFLYDNMCEEDLQILKHIDKKHVQSLNMTDENISSLKLIIINDILQTSVHLKQLVLKSSSLQRNMNISDTWCCQNIESLCLDHFEISHLDLSTYIHLDFLQLNAVELLTYLHVPPYVQYLNLQDIKYLEDLDLSKCEKLRKIHIKICLSDPDLSACLQLQQPNRERHQGIKELDLSASTQLQQLHLKGLSELKQLDLSGSTQLQQLHLDGVSDLNQLDLSGITQLQQLHLDGISELRQLDLSDSTQLQQLHLDGLSRIKQLDMSACSQLQQIHLESLSGIKQIDLSACTHLQQLHLGGLWTTKQQELLWGIKQLDVSVCTHLKQVYLERLCDITQLDLSACTQLQHLHLKYLSDMKQIDLSICRHLQQLHLERLCEIDQLDMSACTQLQQLHLEGLWRIRHLDLFACTNLQQFHLDGLWEIKQLDLSACTLLQQLHLEGLWRLTELDLSACTQLKHIHLERLTRIKQLDLSACTLLQQLHLKYLSDIKQLDLSSGRHVQQHTRVGLLKRFKQRDLSSCTELQELHLEGLWGLKSLDLSSCTQLQHTYLDERLKSKTTRPVSKYTDSDE